MDIEKLANDFESRLERIVEKYQGIPVAISGGVDSGLLAAMVSPDFVISVDLPGGEKYDESKYSRKVAKHLSLEHVVVNPNPKDFEKGVTESVKAIGRPIPHFNIFPLWSMYKELAKRGVKEVILGDGPDETMCGYTRNLIMAHIYGVYKFEGFRNYKKMIDKILPDPAITYSELIGKDYTQVKKLMRGREILKAVNKVDIELMRPDMDDMSNGIAKLFGIRNIRPYQDKKAFDDWQFDLPDEAKIFDSEYGKYVLRVVAGRYLPEEIAWRKQKVGGPVYPVGIIWKQEDEFSKEKWINYQKKILAKR